MDTTSSNSNSNSLIQNGGGSNGENRGIKRKKKVKIDWICVNPDCTKSKNDNVITAKPFVISYFGGKSEDGRKRKVCEECFVKAR